MLVFIRERLGSIEHDQDEVGIGESFHGFADADALRLIERAANPGGVDQLDRNAADGDGFADQIASGAGRRGYDGALTLDQAVEQAGFADVWAADDGERQTFVDDLSVGEGGGKFFKRRSDCGDSLKNLIGGKNRDVVFGEVNAGFEALRSARPASV